MTAPILIPFALAVAAATALSAAAEEARVRSPDGSIEVTLRCEDGALSYALDFLSPSVTYEATCYEDAPDSHYINNREAYRLRRLRVTRGDRITARMAPGGGHCIWLRPFGVDR